APWAVVGLGGARLYFLGPDDLLRQADITADGRLLEPPRVARQLGKLRSVAASPKRLGLAYVPAAGDQVVYRSAEGSSRPIRRGEFLYLTPHAIAPDGRTIAVDSGTSVIRKLTLVDLSTSQERGSLTYAGAFLWAPDGQAVVVESAAPAEPPLPWEDGGTRNLTLHRLQPKQVARLAVGDAGSVWSLLRWDHPSRLEALLTRYQRTPDGDAQPLSETRFGLDPATGQRQELGPDTRARSSHELLARRLPGGEYEPVGELSHSRFLLYRQHSGQATELWLMPHDGSREPVLLGPAPASTEPLVASWGALPE
ncbi:MAG: hypothetical protein HUU35_04010, partial [Armatimonadetes bacterium]|nr:hypothetical protein [Armatimonadota bacterium]